MPKDWLVGVSLDLHEWSFWVVDSKKCLTKLFLICVHCGRFSISKPAVRNFSGSAGAKPSANPPSLIVDYIYQFHVVISKVEPETPLFNRIFYLRVYEVVLITCSCNKKYLLVLLSKTQSSTRRCSAVLVINFKERIGIINWWGSGIDTVSKKPTTCLPF